MIRAEDEEDVEEAVEETEVERAAAGLWWKTWFK